MLLVAFYNFVCFSIKSLFQFYKNLINLSFCSIFTSTSSKDTTCYRLYYTFAVQVDRTQGLNNLNVHNNIKYTRNITDCLRGNETPSMLRAVIVIEMNDHLMNDVLDSRTLYLVLDGRRLKG